MSEGGEVYLSFILGFTIGGAVFGLMGRSNEPISRITPYFHDVNADGREDLILQGSEGSSQTIYLQQQDGRYKLLGEVVSLEKEQIEARAKSFLESQVEK